MKIIARNIIHLDTVHSTNLYVSDEISKGKVFQDGDVIVCFEQVMGKGLDLNTWESEAGQNLTMTIFLQPIFLKVEKQFDLNKAISLGILDFIKIKLSDKTVKIKWPNDIYIDNGKVGGILINNTISGREFINSVAGIGININQIRFLSNAPNPVSIRQYLGQKLDLNICLEEVCRCINTRYNMLIDGRLNEINMDYISDLYRWNEFHNYIYEGKKIAAKILGINEYGQLQLKTDLQQLLTCDLKEVEFII